MVEFGVFQTVENGSDLFSTEDELPHIVSRIDLFGNLGVWRLLRPANLTTRVR